MAKLQDKFVNRALASVSITAANSEKFEQIRFGVGTFQGIALLLHRVNWFISSGTFPDLQADTDELFMAITTRDDLTSAIPSQQSVICAKHIVAQGATIENVVMPLVSDFTAFPGGGKLVPANPLFLMVDSVGFVNLPTVYVEMYFTFIQLSDKESIELLQSMVNPNI